MKIATWNVNSLRSREERLCNWLVQHTPDVLCLQELKATEDQLPLDRLASLGYRAVVNGQKTYNGVAILSRAQPVEVRVGLDDGVDDPQARLVSAQVAGVTVVCVYVPNGQAPGTDKWAYKLTWLQRLLDWLDRHHRPDQPLVLCGDLNVAPFDIDMARPAEWRGTAMHTPELTAWFQALHAWGLHDVVRQLRPEVGLYSWWDYRMLGFQKNNGLRIDHLLATAPLAQLARAALLDRDERRGDKPSDHVPVMVEFDWT